MKTINFRVNNVFKKVSINLLLFKGADSLLTISYFSIDSPLTHQKRQSQNTRD